MKYIIDSASVALIPLPSGMLISINDVNFQLAGTVTFTANSKTITIPGNNISFPMIYAEPVLLTATGGPIEIMATYVGDQFAYRTMDPGIHPQSAGFYPGHWGTGTGSVPRNGPNSYTESGGSGWYPY